MLSHSGKNRRVNINTPFGPSATQPGSGGRNPSMDSFEEDSYSLEEGDDPGNPDNPDLEDVDNLENANVDPVLGRLRPKGPKIKAPVRRRIRRRHRFTTPSSQRSRRRLTMRKTRKNPMYKRRERGRSKFLSGKGGRRRRSASLLDFGRKLDRVASSYPGLSGVVSELRSGLDKQKKRHLIRYALDVGDLELNRLVLSFVGEGKRASSGFSGLVRYAMDNRDPYLAEIVLGFRS